MANNTPTTKIPQIGGNYYEQIFSTAYADDFMYYNIGRNVALDVSKIAEEYISYIIVDRAIAYTSLSHKIYGTQHLWWIIVTLNSLNPINLPPIGSTLAIIKPKYIQYVLDTIKRQL